MAKPITTVIFNDLNSGHSKLFTLCNLSSPRGVSHMKKLGMLVSLLRGINQGF